MSHRRELGIAMVFLLLVPVARAQDEALTPTAEPPVPVAIPLADVSLRSEELGANLRRIEALLEPSYEIQAIETAVAETSDELAALRAKLDAVDADEISTRMLEDHRLEWEEFDQKLATWMSELQTRWQTLAQEANDLSASRVEWALTRESAIRDTAPLEIVEQIDRQRERLDAVDAQLSERGESLGSVLARVSRGREISTDALDRLSVVAAKVRSRVWTRNAAPLWRLSESSAGSTIRVSAAEAQKYWLDSARAFALAHQGSFLFVLFCFVTFLLATLVSQRRSRSWPTNEPGLDDARFVVSRPFSTALAFTVVVVVFVLDNTVAPVQDMVMFLAVIPIARLGSGLLPPPARVALYGGLGLLIFDRIWATAPDGSFLRRIVLVLLTAVALAAAVALISRWRTDPSTKASGWWRVAWLLLGIATILLTVSLIANILGWVSLSENLTDATTTATFGAIAWVTVVLALTALVPVAVRSPLGIVFPSLRRHGDRFASATLVVASSVAFIWWARGSLRNFQLLEQLAERVRAALAASVAIGGLEISFGRVVAAVAILLMTWLVARLARFALREEILPRVRLPAGADHSVVSVVNYVVWGSGLLLSAAAAGLTGTQLTVVFGALGVGIGFGLQSIVSNFVSGLILIFERPIKVGDSVQTKDHFGVVTDIGIRASMIRTFDGAEVVVPNGDLVAKELVNWTRTDMTRRVEVRVHVALGSDPNRVLEILRDAASAHPKTLDSPAPSAFMTGFGESSLDFRLFTWSRIEDFLQVSSDLHVAINDDLKSAGIKIPFPQRGLHVHPTDDDTLAS